MIYEIRLERGKNHGEIRFASWVGPHQELFWNRNQNVPIQNTPAFSGVSEYSGDVLRMQYMKFGCTVL